MPSPKRLSRVFLSSTCCSLHLFHISDSHPRKGIVGNALIEMCDVSRGCTTGSCNPSLFVRFVLHAGIFTITGLKRCLITSSMTWCRSRSCECFNNTHAANTAPLLSKAATSVHYATRCPSRVRHRGGVHTIRDLSGIFRGIVSWFKWPTDLYYPFNVRFVTFIAGIWKATSLWRCLITSSTAPCHFRSCECS